MKDSDPRIQRAANLLAECRAAVAFTGAGISTPSGIPDFRSPETGLWARLKATGADEAQTGTIQAGRDELRLPADAYSKQRFPDEN